MRGAPKGSPRTHANLIWVSKKAVRDRLSDIRVSLAGRLWSGRHRLLQVLVDLVEEADGRQPGLVGADEQRKVLGHVAGLDGLDAHRLQRVDEELQLRIVVELKPFADTLETACIPTVESGNT